MAASDPTLRPQIQAATTYHDQLVPALMKECPGMPALLVTAVKRDPEARDRP